MSTVILLEDEPLSSVLVTWLSWMIVLILFAICIIWGSNYFSRSNDCYIHHNHRIGHPVHDIKHRRWHKHFDQVDGMLVTKPYDNVIQVKGVSETGHNIWDYMDAKGYFSDTPRTHHRAHDYNYLSTINYY